MAKDGYLAHKLLAAGFLYLITLEAAAGAPQDIPDAATNPEVIELARFAVDEHNKLENELLVFKEVVKASEEIVAGQLYGITLKAAKPGDVSHLYEAKVLLPAAPVEVKVLLEFKPTSETPQPRPPGSTVGAPGDIPDAATNPEVIELARFAVDEHNKKENEHLVFKEVVRASEQVVAGLLYRITLKAAKHGDVSHSYEAQVLLPAGIHAKVLLEFKPLVGDIQATTHSVFADDILTSNSSANHVHMPLMKDDHLQS
ncbi:hypothetical protein Tsubulata_007370 [Turnera subulata]|uniref:Cysteine proteinase inhibitor n=1 Tax=Turnera subulata TaxID=218843 RepID=A0A9Q0F9I3_9ROSI|nr:hypothetical protein Tsubulata_007370 [Turnera subulata]